MAAQPPEVPRNAAISGLFMHAFLSHGQQCPWLFRAKIREADKIVFEDRNGYGLQGIVIQAEAGLFHVQSGDVTIPCVLRGRLKREWQRVTSLVVVGDRVSISTSGDGTGAINEIHERKTKLSRPGFHGYEHVIAANVDQLLIVASALSPRFKRGIVERFLVVARQGGLEPILVVNKCDLEDERTIRSWVAPFEGIGLPATLVSAVTGTGLDELRSQLRGRISVLAGQSGVGKSSLVNALFPELQLRTQGVSIHNKGRHTTTSSRLYQLPTSGYLVDTPGIKSLELADTDQEDLAEAFPDIEEFAAACKFRDCSHIHEPRCAVRAAVDTGKLEQARYESYVRLQRGR